MTRLTCSTCRRRLVAIAGRRLTCPSPHCPGHKPNATAPNPEHPMTSLSARACAALARTYASSHPDATRSQLLQHLHRAGADQARAELGLRLAHDRGWLPQGGATNFSTSNTPRHPALADFSPRSSEGRT